MNAIQNAAATIATALGHGRLITIPLPNGTPATVVAVEATEAGVLASVHPHDAANGLAFQVYLHDEALDRALSAASAS
jgi:hypothetical protein